MIKSIKSSASPLTVTLSVWKALFLREALIRLFGGRAAWMWLLLEPVIHIAVMLILFTTIRMRVVGGIELPVWLVSGMCCYFMFKRSFGQVSNAVSASQALFSYRQVRPVDVGLVRAFFEGMLNIFATFLIMLIIALFGFDMIPNDPLTVMEAFLGLWLIGLGFGLIMCVVKELIPELARLIDFVQMPLYLCSGVMMPLTAVPLPYRDWLLFNPLLHAVELSRLGFAPYYHVMEGLSISYIYNFAIALLFFGLTLQRRFVRRLIRQ